MIYDYFYVYCRNKDTSKHAHHLWGVWRRQQHQHADFSGAFSFSASAVLPSQREQIRARAATLEWAELGLLILGIHGLEPLATLNRWGQTRCPSGTVCSATGRHSLTRGQEEMWDFRALPSPIHYFFLQILFSSFMFSASTETLVLSSPGSCSHTTNTNSWVGSFYIKINRSLKTPREAGGQH